jgi:hypothetical protein
MKITAQITIKAGTRADIDRIIDQIEFEHSIGEQDVEIIEPDDSENTYTRQ